jgi:hypothetical protein
VSTTIVGVYKVPRRKDVALVEVVVNRAPSKVDVGKFTQAERGVDQADWQVPYDERYLNVDGTKEIGERWESWHRKPGVKEPTTARIVFFFHFLDSHRPFITPDGEAALPPQTSLPARLAFVTYEPPD